MSKEFREFSITEVKHILSQSTGNMLSEFNVANLDKHIKLCVIIKKALKNKREEKKK